MSSFKINQSIKNALYSNGLHTSSNTSGSFTINDPSPNSLQLPNNQTPSSSGSFKIKIPTQNALFSQKQNKNSFISLWEILSNSETLTIPIDDSTYNYSFMIDWGDNTTENIVAGPSAPIGSISHIYTTANNYKVIIDGVFPAIQIGNSADKDKLLEVINIGDVGWQILDLAFINCNNLTVFNGTSGLTSVSSCDNAWRNTGLISFNTSGLTSVTICNSAWTGCVGLTSFNTSGLISVTSCSFSWNGCVGLTSFDESGLISVTGCNNSWSGCVGLTSFNTSGLTSVISCVDAWFDCTGLTVFNAVGLTSVTNCTDAWDNTTSFGAQATSFPNIPTSLFLATGWATAFTGSGITPNPPI